MTIENLLDRVREMKSELNSIRYKVYRMQWPRGRSDDPGPPPGLEDYVKTRETEPNTTWNQTG